MRVAVLSFLIWLVATATVVFLAWLAFPADVPSQMFFGRLLFVAWLVTANKVPSLMMIWVARRSSRSRYAAVLGSLHILTFIYSVMAAFVLIAHVVGLPFFAQSTWHLSIQVVLLAAAALIGLCIALAVEAGVERRREP
jgi:hypothetical protein